MLKVRPHCVAVCTSASKGGHMETLQQSGHVQMIYDFPRSKGAIQERVFQCLWKRIKWNQAMQFPFLNNRMMTANTQKENGEDFRTKFFYDYRRSIPFKINKNQVKDTITSRQSKSFKIKN